MTEAQIQAAVIAHWRALGVQGSLVAAIPNQRAHGQPGLTAGLFDLLVMAPGLPVGFIELKARRGRSGVSKAQLRFGYLCHTLGIPHAITFGRDEPIEVLEQWTVVRREVR